MCGIIGYIGDELALPIIKEFGQKRHGRIKSQNIVRH